MSPLCLAGPALCRSAAVSLYTAPHPAATVQLIPAQKSASTDTLCLPCSIGVGRTCEPSSSVISRAMAWSGQLVTTIPPDTGATVYPQKIIRVQGTRRGMPGVAGMAVPKSAGRRQPRSPELYDGEEFHCIRSGQFNNWASASQSRAGGAGRGGDTGSIAGIRV